MKRKKKKEEYLFYFIIIVKFTRKSIVGHSENTKLIQSDKNRKLKRAMIYVRKVNGR